ncbi:MAG TPA: ParB/RepB/Spo0J family partition protein, partial [Chromatiaceae bacterium]|nr:ParB/RepB/Spo0J family partition protein [Chromatiaceae bacterium]
MRSIKADHAIQQRETLIDGAVLNDYAEAMTAGSVFPPIVVFYDGTVHWLADGYHRLEAADEAGLKEITAEVRPGTKRDATL